MQTLSKRSVAGLVFDHQTGNLLLIKRRDVPMWVLPGGGVEPEETPAEAVVREIKEETGLNVVIVRQIAHYHPINQLANDTYTYECRVLSGEMHVGDETQFVDFFPTSSMPTPFFFIHQEWIDDALMNSPEVISKSLDSVSYWNLFKQFVTHPIFVLRLLLSRLGFRINKKG